MQYYDEPDWLKLLFCFPPNMIPSSPPPLLPLPIFFPSTGSPILNGVCPLLSTRLPRHTQVSVSCPDPTLSRGNNNPGVGFLSAGVGSGHETTIYYELNANLLCCAEYLFSSTAFCTVVPVIHSLSADMEMLDMKVTNGEAE